VERPIRRLASFLACVALVCAIDPAGVGGGVYAHGGPDALTFHRPGSIPADLAAGRLSPRLLASARQLQSYEFHPAVGAAASARPGAGRWTRLARPSTCVAPVPAIDAHVDRGPPHTLLS
jgi:hypothetical protein